MLETKCKKLDEEKNKLQVVVDLLTSGDKVNKDENLLIEQN